MKNKYLLLVCILFSFGIVKSLAQGIGIGSPSFTPVASALLELRGSDKGFLTTRVSWALMPASPADGLLVYVNAGSPPEGNGFYYYDGVSLSWKKVGIPYSAGTGINITGNVISTIYGTIAGTSAEGNHTHTQLHNQSHSMTSVADHTAGNWRVFYSNGSGQVVELALGSSGQVLSSNGVTAAPSWVNASGGTVTSVSGVLPISVINGTTTPVISVASNSQSSAGVVAAGGANANYVWKTDASGNPAWRADDNTTYTAGNGLTLTGTQFSLSTPVSIANGGTNAASYTANQFLWYNGTSIVASGFSNSSFATAAHTHALLTRGTGLTGSNYDGSMATTWAVDFGGTGTATTVSHSDHNHTGVYDNYNYWTLQGSGANASNVTTGTVINLTGGGSTTVTKAGNTVTISSTGTTYTAGTGINIAGTTISNTGVLSLTAGSGISLSGSTGNITITSTATGITGSGTLNYIPKWTPNGTNLGNSIMSESGTFISINGSLLTTTNGYHNFGVTQGTTGYGFRDNAGTMEYKNSGAPNWTPFPAPPPAGSSTEWWYRPSGMPYIQPLTNSNVRIYDVTSQPYGIYYDGGTNTVGGYFRTTSNISGTTAVQGFSDVAGQQQYGYLGYNGSITVGTTTIGGASVYGWTNDPNSTGVYGRTTGNASVAAVLGYSNVWIPGYFYCDNASASYNPPGLYGQLNVTSTTLGGNQSAIRGYNDRGTTTGNPGYTIGVDATADAQNQDALAVQGIAYSNMTTRAGGFFEACDFAGNILAYAYVGTSYGGTNRKIYGTNSVSEIIPTENHGRITLTCPESPEYWYQDYGTVKMVNGKAHVDLDPILKDIIFVNDENPIRVFCTPVDMPEYNGVYITNRNESGFDIIELNGGTHSGTLDYQVIVKPKTNYGEGRFMQAPGPVGCKTENESIKAKAKNQPDPTKIFHWPADNIVYGYDLKKQQKSPLTKSK